MCWIFTHFEDEIVFYITFKSNIKRKKEKTGKSRVDISLDWYTFDTVFIVVDDSSLGTPIRGINVFTRWIIKEKEINTTYCILHMKFRPTFPLNIQFWINAFDLK